MSMIRADTPFVLLDDARTSHAAPARLYRDPKKLLIANKSDEIHAVLTAASQAQADGFHVAGYLAYEAGFAFEESLPDRTPGGAMPLMWFGVFCDYQEIDSDAVPSILPDPDGAWISPLQPQIGYDDYARAFGAAQDYINSGDIYQVNLTFPATARYQGDPLALYAAIRPRASAGNGGIVWTGQQWHLSFSPELFFSLKAGRVTARPMKGTASRSSCPAADAAAADNLRNDPKQRAENLMIVDLLRNDLSRVCESGSVDVPDLFRIESYPTVHQMTSTVTGILSSGHGAADLIEAIYPCGSITGAPKIRAMQIIGELEKTPRNLYCGSIGRIDADGSAAFNVAIRTFCLNEEAKQVSLGLGSGVVADSAVTAEWAECLAKGEFARMTGGIAGSYGFDLIETMRFEPDTGLTRLERHLDRMKSSARLFGFEFDRHAARNQLHAVTFHLAAASKIRLLCSRSGAIAIEVRDVPPPVHRPWIAAIVPLPVRSSDFRLSHKTTDRGFYDDARNAAGDVDEILFTDHAGQLTEGSFTSIFVERENTLLTPPLSRGLLPSVLRSELIETGRATEASLEPGDLANGFFVGNSLRGLIPATLGSKPVAI
jgi:para-aminobenzoate synthetase / 4-amino-4-deoxychorismate lyase